MAPHRLLAPAVEVARARPGAIHIRARGQSLVEFTLIVPILIVLLLLIADFGRYFAAGITVESMARDAAEVGAQQYLEAVGAPPAVPDAAGYQFIRATAARVVCNEAVVLPNAGHVSATSTCGGVPAEDDPLGDLGIPTSVCVHDDNDPGCIETFSTPRGGVPPECTPFLAGGSNAMRPASETSRYVEVRVCYRFSTFFQATIPFIGGALTAPFGDFYILRSRTFTVADY